MKPKQRPLPKPVPPRTVKPAPWVGQISRSAVKAAVKFVMEKR